MLNTETIVHPRLQHLSLTTGRVDEMIHWYRTVLGMNLLHYNQNPTAAAGENPGIVAAWLSNDEVHHRIAILGVPGLTADPERPRHPGFSTSASNTHPSTTCSGPGRGWPTPISCP